MKLSDITIDYIKEFLKIKKDDDLSQVIGVPTNTIRTWKSRGIPSKEKLRLIEEFQIEMSLAGGKPQIPDNFKETMGKVWSAMDSNQQTKQSTTPLHVEHIQIEKLSVKASCGGGNNLEAIDCFDVMDTLSLDMKLFKTPQKDLKAIEVEGYSMIPTLLPGNIVIFKEDVRFGGDGLYVLNYQNTLMVKIVQLNPKGCFDIVSSNQDYKSYEVCKEDQNVFAIVGKVIKVIM